MLCHVMLRRVMSHHITSRRDATVVFCRGLLFHTMSHVMSCHVIMSCHFFLMEKVGKILILDVALAKTQQNKKGHLRLVIYRHDIQLRLTYQAFGPSVV